MGRSQVRYNRTHGRGRGRGRGRGGHGGRKGGTAAASQSVAALGDNAFRYGRSEGQKKGDGVGGEYMFSDYGGFDGEHGPSHHRVGEREEVVGGVGPTSATAIDARMLAACLRNLPIHEVMRLPEHIGRRLENAYGRGPGNAPPSPLPSKSPPPPSPSRNFVEDEIDAAATDGVKALVHPVMDTTEEEKSSKVPAEDGEDEEEDLDAWLDSVIS